MGTQSRALATTRSREMRRILRWEIEARSLRAQAGSLLARVGLLQRKICAQERTLTPEQRRELQLGLEARRQKEREWGAR